MSTTPNPAVFIIGTGAVGTALAMKLQRAGLPVAAIHGRQAADAAAAGALAGVLGTSGDYPDLISEADIIVVAVSDDAISKVAAELLELDLLRSNQVVLHCSGALAAAEALGPAKGKVRGLGTLHPLISFPDARLAAAALRGATFTVEGDLAGREAATLLAEKLGGTVYEIDGAQMALYHAAAVIACNYVVALADAGRELLTLAGFPGDKALLALVPLIGGTVRNLADLGLPDALTGPIARGEVHAIDKHLLRLAQAKPELVPLYREAGLRAVEIARKLDEANPKNLDAIEERLKSEPNPQAAAKPKH